MEATAFEVKKVARLLFVVKFQQEKCVFEAL